MWLSSWKKRAGSSGVQNNVADRESAFADGKRRISRHFGAQQHDGGTG
jgi:hypothetical protein